jgi:hypothetical protein
MERFNSAVGLLLLISAGVTVVLIISTSTSLPSIAQAPTSSIPETSSSVLPRPVSTRNADAILPPPVGTAVGTVTPLPQLTATAEAQMTRMAEFPPIPNLTPNPHEQEQRAEAEMFFSLFRRAGTTIAVGTNTIPTGTFQLKTYRVEEVVLPGPTTFTEFTVGNITVDKVWRVTITGGPFYLGQQTLVLYIDGKIVASGYMSSPDAEGAQFILFGDAMLHEGATIGVGLSLGLPIVTLPETLHFEP